MNKRHLHLLGVPRVTYENSNVPRFRSQRTVALLGYLVAERRRLSRAGLAALFWPDEPADKGKANLRRELHNLGQIFPDCWETDRAQVRFVPTNETTIDLDALQQHEAAEEWQAAADLIHGVFLEGLYLEDNPEFDTWLLSERERWQQRTEQILNRVIVQLEQARIALEEAQIHASTLDDSHLSDVGLLHVFWGWVAHLQGQTTSARQRVEMGGNLCLASQFELGHLISLQMIE